MVQIVTAVDLNVIGATKMHDLLVEQIDRHVPNLASGTRGKLSNALRLGLVEDGLPAGFKFLVTDDMALIEPALLYLYEKCVRSARIQSVGKTQKTFAENLYEWFSFLDANGKHWDEVTTGDLEDYSSNLLASYSPLTRRQYSPSTVRLRLTIINDFYRETFNRGWLGHQVHVETSVEVTVEGGKRKVRRINSLLPKGTHKSEPVRPFKRKNVQLVLSYLGPLPPDDGDAYIEQRPVRDRLYATTGLALGLRIEEIEKLTIYQILDLRPESESPDDVTQMLVTKTKGLKARHVYVPNWLRNALLWYIHNERQRAIEKAKALGAVPKNYAPGQLFLNGSEANHRDVGQPFKASTMESVFRNAIKRAGLMHHEEHIHPQSLKVVFELVPDHTFHDLRHTFAVQAYVAYKKMGDVNPIKQVAALLGHASTEVTERTYLSTFTINEAELSDALFGYYKAIRSHG